jgi:hypothetical protein
VRTSLEERIASNTLEVIRFIPTTVSNRSMLYCEVEHRALREVYIDVSFGCFIEKPVSIEYLINRLSAKLD